MTNQRYSTEVSAWPKRVHFGIGSLLDLRDVMAALGVGRAMVICGQTVANGVMLADVRAALGDMYRGAFTEVRAHTPVDEIAQAAAQCRALQADTIISVGGGSAIDAAKGVVLFLATEGDLQPYSIQYAARGMTRRRIEASAVKHIAIPTTAGSGSEVMPTAGIRDPRLGKKIIFWDEKLVPDATILDPSMAVHAGAYLTAASGMTAVARSIEALYSKHRNPISTALALHSARLMLAALPQCIDHPHDLAVRQNCQLACAMASTASVNAMASLVHAIGHVVGGKLGLQHGIAHAILLAPAIRRLLPALGADYVYVLDALGCARSSDAEHAADLASQALSALLGKLPLPQSLREVGLEKEALPQLAAATMNEFMLQNLPVPLALSDVEAVLQEAW